MRKYDKGHLLQLKALALLFVFCLLGIGELHHALEQHRNCGFCTTHEGTILSDSHLHHHQRCEACHFVLSSSPTPPQAPVLQAKVFSLHKPKAVLLPSHPVLGYFHSVSLRAPPAFRA